MGVAFFSSLAICAGGALVRRGQKNLRRRTLLKRYADRLVGLIETNATLLETLRRAPEETTRRERRLCGVPVEVELRIFSKASGAYCICIRDRSSFFNRRFPVCRDGNLLR